MSEVPRYRAIVEVLACPFFYYRRGIDVRRMLLLFFFTLVTGPRRSLSLKLSDTKVYEPQIRARMHFWTGHISMT